MVFGFLAVGGFCIYFNHRLSEKGNDITNPSNGELFNKKEVQSVPDSTTNASLKALQSLFF